jgi:hypothetical protein
MVVSQDYKFADFTVLIGGQSNETYVVRQGGLDAEEVGEGHGWASQHGGALAHRRAGLDGAKGQLR